MYWSADHGDSVFRGTWFFQDGWAPLDEIMADTIEQEHVARWKGYSIEEVQVSVFLVIKWMQVAITKYIKKV